MLARCLLLLAILLLGGAREAAANLIADKLILNFTPTGGTRQDITIANTGADTLYVTAEVQEIVNDGNESETLRSGLSPDEAGILVTPNKLVLEPGQRRVIRAVLVRRPTDQERAYRIRIAPTVGEFIIDETEKPKGPKPMIKVLVGYGALVLVRPVPVRESLVIERRGPELFARNDGNASVLLLGGVQCPPGENDIERCERLQGKRLHPGREYHAPLKLDTPVKVTIETYRGSETREY